MRIMLKRYLSTWCAVIVITASIAVEERGLPEPLRGQIVVDPTILNGCGGMKVLPCSFVAPEIRRDSSIVEPDYRMGRERGINCKSSGK